MESEPAVPDDSRIYSICGIRVFTAWNRDPQEVQDRNLRFGNLGRGGPIWTYRLGLLCGRRAEPSDMGVSELARCGVFCGDVCLYQISGEEVVLRDNEMERGDAIFSKRKLWDLFDSYLHYEYNSP